MIVVSLALAFCIFVWLKTNAFVELLGWLFSWNNCFYVRDFAKQPDILKSNISYPMWLYLNHPCILTKLIGCPLCLSFWANLCFGFSIQEKLAGAFLTLFAFSVLDKNYRHG
jgi:hypothetical protein